MARCVVIGGNGFLGSYVVQELAKMGHSVKSFDHSPPSTSSPDEGIFTAVVGDINDERALAAAVAEQDVVLHFTGGTTPASVDGDATVDLRTTVPESVAVFSAAAAAGAKLVCFASTGGAMYPDINRGRIDEESVPRPISPYAIGKLASEGYLRYFERKAGLRTVSLRISNPYGPRQNANRGQGVIGTFLRAAAARTPVTVYGDGTMVRDYIYAADVARMVAAIVSGSPRHDMYHLASGTGTSVNELIAIVEEVTDRRLERIGAPRPATFVDHVVLDTSRYTGDFPVHKLVEIREGIALTWAAMA